MKFVVDIRIKLAKAKDYNEIFEIVKASVEKTLNMHRAGLSLVLAKLPNHIGAYHVSGSNIIVVNRVLLEAIKNLAPTKLEINSYLYTILIHEYLHTLGYSEEKDVRPLVGKIVKENVGEDHIAVKMSNGELAQLYPKLKLLGPGDYDNDYYELIDSFDKPNYIG